MYRKFATLAVSGLLLTRRRTIAQKSDCRARDRVFRLVAQAFGYGRE